MTRLEQLYLFLKFHLAPDSQAKQEIWSTCSSYEYTEANVIKVARDILDGTPGLSPDEISFLRIIAEPSDLVAGTTDEQWAERIAACNSDTEAAHADADRLLANLVQELGYPKSAAAWQAVDKWYA